MQCYTELLPPSGVTHALAVPFLSATSNNLIVVRSSLLQVFSLRSSPTPRQNENAETHLTTPTATDSHLTRTKLILEKEYPLPGTVTDLSRVKILNSKSGGEAILLAVRNAKLSLIEWDPERHGISTISIHYYERDDLTRSPWVPDLSNCGSALSVDPSSRCAVFNFGIRNLAILPFHQAGDDLVMDDYDPELDGERLSDGQGSAANHVDGQHRGGATYGTPYAASFVLPLTAFDPALLHPVSLAFLYEYREPTFGIVYSQVATSSALINERKDVMTYGVFTLDLEQRASTSLLSVSKLPSDLFKVVALPPPVGGALLIGNNEVVHVDQAGKTNAIGVNEFARQMSSFSMSDQSDLSLRLENCVVERLGGDSSDLLLILASGDMALIRFKLDGRSVSGMKLHALPRQTGEHIVKSTASCSACFEDGNVFVGSEDADSVLLGWSRSSALSKKKQVSTGIEDLSDDDLMDDEDVYEDDLYSTAPDPRASSSNPTSEFYHFHLNDRLSSIGPLRDLTLGKPASCSQEEKDSGEDDVLADLELVGASGSGRSGSLVVIKREVDPCVKMNTKIDDAEGVWSTTLHRGRKSGQPSADGSESGQSRHFIIVSKPTADNREVSEILEVDGKDMNPIKAPEFNPNEDFTIDIGPLADSTRLVQVLQSEVRSYDIDLGLSQIYPLWDEDVEEERIAITASFTDPYLAIIRDDAALLLLQCDESGDLDAVSIPDELSGPKWRSARLYQDHSHVFAAPSEHGSDDVLANTLLFLLSIDSKLSIFNLTDMKMLDVIDGVDCLQPVLSSEAPRRSNNREPLKEALVADLGDQWIRSPYLIVRTETDELIYYKPVFHTVSNGDGSSKSLRFHRETNHNLTDTAAAAASTVEMQQQSKPLRVLSNVSGYSTVFLPGASAGFVMRTAASSPHLVRLRGNFIRWLSGHDSAGSGCDHGFIYVDSASQIRACQLPCGTQFDYSWPLRKISLDEQIDHLTFSTTSNTYVVGTSHDAEFKLPDNDELHPEWRNEAITFCPHVPHSSVKVVNPETWTVIDEYPLEAAEHITAVQNVNMEISENTHERKNLIVVGTAIVKGEDIPARGCIYVFDVINVVPDPEKPETGRKLKLVGKESVKGAVTALSGIGGQGFIIVAQGQKCMVRGLKEDGSLLPVAFMDMSCYVSVAKELKGTGMCLLGDAVKGIWFAGYSEEPYKMSLFGKDPEYLEVVSAEFLPDGNKLYILVADSDCNLHVLQYDPEDPKSSNGDRLLHRSKFYTGNFATQMILLPRTAVPSEQDHHHQNIDTSSQNDMMIDSDSPSPHATHQVLLASQNGSLALITSVSEESYRRLSALQSQLTNTIEHPCGLNPRAFRAVESDGTGGRGMVDGNLLRQWLNLGKQRQAEISGRVGATQWEIRGDLESIGGDGLGYL
ncbi:Protein c.t1.c1 [Penicillium diatomitis]|uniref:Protein CFT1 n=1 Tax=Penicillium diatomitis TaxID=2819901 RepID=A0A9X0BZU5_9EURO|nr:Protein c.t1.c1 [Penicillium diatomitis]KAJ5491547.1 Protein c.t1.c1 [Penicillium diatomitis]